MTHPEEKMESGNPSELGMLILDIFQSFCLIAWSLLRVYQVMVELRFLIQWFLNINPYFEPFQTLWALTNPFFNFGRALYPKIIGLDLTPMINYKLFMIVEKTFDRMAHGIDVYNYEKFYDASLFQQRTTAIEDIKLPDYITPLDIQ